MKIKKYIADSMTEAVRLVKNELGEDAVILKSKEISSKGMLGLFKKKKFEVIAAIDPRPISTESSRQPTVGEPKIKQIWQDNNNEKEIILREIKALKQMITTNNQTNYQGPFNTLYQYFLEQEVSETLSKQIIDELIDLYKEEHEVTFSTLITEVHTKIAAKVDQLAPELEVASEKIIHFIGPTGVGKTTTLAKIAAEKILKNKHKIAFITTDTYRIAAVEQLKTYARILDVPVEVAYSITDYQQALLKFADYDFILVDNAGRNFRDEKYVKDLFAQQDKRSKVYLVLSLTAKAKDITAIYQQFSHLKNKEIIFTKVDETTQYGSILNMIFEENQKIAYFTNGQNVPEDILRPKPNEISNLIVGGIIDL